MKRRVYGRRLVELDGVKVKFELRSDGIWCWEHRHRTRYKVEFMEAWELSRGQSAFSFDREIRVPITQAVSP